MLDKNNIKNLTLGVSSGIILTIFLFVILILGEDILLLSSIVLSLIGVMEITKVLNLSKILVSIIFPFTLFYYIVVVKYAREGILLFLISMILMLLIFYVFAFPKFSIKDIALTIFTIFYVPLMFSFVYLLREQRGHLDNT